MQPVWSVNEWDPLAEVIVGTARGAARLAYEPALAAYYPRADRDFSGGPYPAEDVERAERQLDGFVRTLESYGIVVHRPDPIPQDTPFAALDFTVPRGHAQTCPRDLLLVVGDQIIEAPMGQRGRFFEYRAYRRLLKTYFAAGARWVAAPRPQLSDQSYVAGYSTEDEFYDAGSHASLTEFEPCFDAASFTRCGQDIFCQPDVMTNRFGADWLARHLGPEYRVRTVEFVDRHPQHIDTTLVPLRPGLALTNPERPFKGDGAKIFTDSGWRLVDAVPSVRTGPSSARDISNWISINILMLDPQTAVVESAEEPLVELLGSLEIDVIKCDFDSVFPFGGSFHCCSLDVRRLGPLESYFS